MNLANALNYESDVALIPRQINPTVIIVDVDEFIRESLRVAIGRQGCNVMTFATAQEFLEEPWILGPSCLVADLSLPGVDGLDLQKRMTTERPTTPVIFMSVDCSVPLAVQAVKAGAIEILAKPIVEEFLLAAIQSAVEKSQQRIDREMELHALRSKFACLSSREREVFALVVAGLPNKQVGGNLGISEITVKTHRGNLMRKMNADSLPQLVNMAAKLRLRRMNVASSLVNTPRNFGSYQQVGSYAPKVSISSFV
jgi:FixJ family two-component response regulator